MKFKIQTFIVKKDWEIIHAQWITDQYTTVFPSSIVGRDDDLIYDFPSECEAKDCVNTWPFVFEIREVEVEVK